MCTDLKDVKIMTKKAAGVMIMNVEELKVGLGNICVSQMSRTVKVPFVT